MQSQSRGFSHLADCQLSQISIILWNLNFSYGRSGYTSLLMNYAGCRDRQTESVLHSCATVWLQLIFPRVRVRQRQFVFSKRWISVEITGQALVPLIQENRSCSTPFLATAALMYQLSLSSSCAQTKALRHSFLACL